MKRFNHARDVAITGLSKILKHQQQCLAGDINLASQLLQYWLDLMPIKNDLSEASNQYELLTDFITGNIKALGGSDPVRTS